MNPQQARTILLLHRPWAGESADDETREALALVGQDAELRQWFEAHNASQLGLREALLSNKPPEAFREQIISECLAQKRASSRRQWLAAATALLLAGVAAETWWLFGERAPAEEISFAAYEQRMIRDALRLYRMDQETDDLVKISSFLKERQSPAAYVLPKSLDGVKATGCLATKWQGRPVSMICFHTGKPLPAGQSSDLFLFVIAQNSLPDSPANSDPKIGKINRLSVARWSAEGNTYLLATEHEEFLRGAL